MRGDIRSQAERSSCSFGESSPRQKDDTTAAALALYRRNRPLFVLLRESAYRSESSSDSFVTISRKAAT